MGKGRGNSSSITTNEAIRLDINALFKNDLFKEGMNIDSTFSWSSGANINIVTTCLNQSKKIKLKYTFNGKLKEYEVEIVEIPSNLGKGTIKYFICPISFVRCKSLYCCYNSDVFKSRTAYSNRIYYFIQTISKEYRTATNYNKVDKQIDHLLDTVKHRSYKGKSTKRYNYIKRLIEKRAYLYEKKNEELDRYLYKYLGLKHFT